MKKVKKYTNVENPVYRDMRYRENACLYMIICLYLRLNPNPVLRCRTYTHMNTRSIISLSTFVLLVLTGLIILGLWGCPQYKVYSQRMEGEALLAHAQASKEVAVAEARAKMESAAMLAAADTIRAHGVARSNQIIGESLRNNEAYLHWLWIDNIEKNPQAVIYVPTEANLPILEAGRRPWAKDTAR